MNKRAVSPLIATVLLIAFAVSLGAVVMNLGVNFGRDLCESVDLQIHTVGAPRVCIEKSNDLVLTLNNVGASVDGYRITATGSGDDAAVAKEFSESIKQAEQKKAKMNLGSAQGITVVSITAFIKDQGLVRYCTKKSRDYTPIPRC